MKKMTYVLVAVTAAAAVACSPGYKKTKSGMKYRVFEGKATGFNTAAKNDTTKAVKVGSIVKFNFSFSIARKGHKDTLIQSSYDKVAQYAPYDTSAMVALTPIEALGFGKVGDSIEFEVPVDTLIARQMVPESPLFTKGGKILGKISILDVFTSHDSARIDNEKAVKAFLDKEEARKKVQIVDQQKAIEKYLASKNIKATKTEKGTYFLIEKQGDGVKIDSGKVVSIKYRGYTEDGKEFDSNMDTTKANGGRPFELPVGMNAAVPGFEDGVLQFTKGAKGKIFIPAVLAYDTEEKPGIPKNSNLIFEIEIVDVKAAPKEGRVPSATPQITPEQMKAIEEELRQNKSGVPAHDQ